MPLLLPYSLLGWPTSSTAGMMPPYEAQGELPRIPIPRTTVNKGAARGPRRRGSGKLYLRDQERQQETRSRGEGDPRAAFPVGVGHERVGKRSEHRASSEGEQHRQRPLPRSRECDIAEHYSGG